MDSVRLWFRQAPTCHGVSEWPGGLRRRMYLPRARRLAGGTQNVVVMKLAAALLLSCCGQRQSPPTPAPHVARSRPGAASDSAENRRIQPRRCSWRTNHRENPPAGCPCSGP